jgi:hypothetical protein
LIRRHVREDSSTLVEVLAPAWQCKRRTVWDHMLRVTRPLSPWHIARACEALKLLPEDRLELMRQGAKEAGWKIE